MESIVGQTVSHYAFLEKLGAGGMGEIYKARDSRLNRVVAVKVLSPGRTRDPERRRRFIQEAQAASALNHPNIVTIHDILPEGDTQYMVMEHVSGKTLQELIAAGPLPIAEVLQISAQMANALAAAHAAGIIHRDFKPANVMVTSSGLVKVLDFGLAKLMDPAARMPSHAGGLNEAITLTAAPLTVEGTIMGTLNYMSPEQAEGLKVDTRSDIFSFGSVLYEMVTGQKAFDGDSPISTLSAVLRDEVMPISQIAPEVPAELDELIAGCLRKNPDERWQSMNDLAAAMRTLRARFDSGVLSGTSGAVPASIQPPMVSTSKTAAVSGAASKTQAMKSISLGATCAAVVALVIAGVWWQTHRQPATPSPSQAKTAPVAIATPPSPQPAPVSPSPSEPAIQAPAANPIASTAAPPPPRSTSNFPFAKSLKVPVPPPVAETTAPVQPKPLPAPPALPATVAAAPVAHAPAAPAGVPVTLGDGVPFRIALLDDIPIDTEVGRSLRFRVLDGVQSGDVVVIAKGAIVTGSVAALGGKRNFFGERSKARFRLISVESVGDSKINVRATPALKGDGDDTRPLEVQKGTKDKNLIAASGAEYVAYIAGDQTLSVHK